MSPDEIGRLFDRTTGRQIVIIDGKPVALMRTNYDQDAMFKSFMPRQVATSNEERFA